MIAQTLDSVGPDLNVKSSLMRAFDGVGFFFRGVKSIFTRADLLGISVITVAINFVIYAALMAVAYFFTDDILDLIGLEAAWARYLVGTVIVIAWVIVCVFVAIFIAQIISGFLLDMLSEKTEKHIVGEVNSPPFKVSTFITELLIQLKFMIVSLLITVPLGLALGWIPVVGQVLVVLVGAIFVGGNFLFPALARHELTYQERMSIVKNNKAVLLGFGAIASIFPFLLVPLCTPALVVGGTKIYLNLVAHDRAPSKIAPGRLAALRS